MAFENTIITKEDDEKYRLSEIYYKYNPHYETFINELRWTIDREKDCWAWFLYSFPGYEHDHDYDTKSIWILYHKGEIIEMIIDHEVNINRKVVPEEFHRIWKLLDLKPNHTQSLNKQDILCLLKEILEAYRDCDLWKPESNYTMELQDLTNRGAK